MHDGIKFRPWCGNGLWVRNVQRRKLNNRNLILLSKRYQAGDQLQWVWKLLECMIFFKSWIKMIFLICCFNFLSWITNFVWNLWTNINSFTLIHALIALLYCSLFIYCIFILFSLEKPHTKVYVLAKYK